MVVVGESEMGCGSVSEIVVGVKGGVCEEVGGGHTRMNLRIPERSIRMPIKS